MQFRHPLFRIYEWTVKWRDESGGTGGQYAETLEKAEMLRQAILGTFVGMLPAGFMVVRPAGVKVIEAWIEPYDGPEQRKSQL